MPISALTTAAPVAALSGLNAAQQQLQSAGHNIANLATPNFRREEVQLSTRPNGGGVSATTSQSAVEGPAIETDLVRQLQAKNAFLANLQVFKTHDQLTGTLLRMKG